MHFIEKQRSPESTYWDVKMCVRVCALSFFYSGTGNDLVSFPPQWTHPPWQNKSDLSPLISGFKIVLCNVKITSDNLQLCLQLKCILLFADFSAYRHSFCCYYQFNAFFCRYFCFNCRLCCVLLLLFVILKKHLFPVWYTSVGNCVQV